MRRSFVLIVAVALVAALAAPAVAGPVDLTGFVRIKPYVSNFDTYGAGFIKPTKDAASKAYVDQRTRLKFTAGDENVKAVSFFEFDQVWGDSAYTTGRGVGGGLEADTNNLETKNLFVWFKVPNTSFDVTAGVQNQNDAYAGIFFGLADFAGVFAKGNAAEGIPVRLGWAKLWENKQDKADDVDLYIAEAGFSPSKELSLGASLYFLNDHSKAVYGPTSGAAATSESTTETIAGFGGRGAYRPYSGFGGYNSLKLYMPGVSAAFDAGVAKLSAFALYQFGTVKTTGGDVDLGGYAADLRGDFAAGKGKGFLEALYVSGYDDSSDKYKGFVDLGYYQLAGSYYSRTDMFLLFPNSDDISTSNALAYDPANGGLGVIHLAGGFTMPLTDKFTGKVGVGYLQAAQDGKRLSHDGLYFADKKMGTEVNAFLNYNITKGLDLGLVGAYAFIGNAYDASSPDADDIYDVHARLNYAF